MTKNNHTIGLVAGAGDLPTYIQKQSIYSIYTVGLAGFCESPTDMMTRVGFVGKIINTFKQQNITQVVLAGGVDVKSLWTLLTDWGGIKFMVKHFILQRRAKRPGDSDLLNLVARELSDHGIELIGVHEVVPELLSDTKVYTSTPPTPSQQDDIQLGIKTAKSHGAKDKGQACIVHNGQIISRETMSGTNDMIDRRGCAGGILVKCIKPQQNPRLDMPTIGLETVKKCIDKRMAGVAVESGKTLFLNQKESIELANTHGIFIIGVAVS